MWQRNGVNSDIFVSTVQYKHLGVCVCVSVVWCEIDLVQAVRVVNKFFSRRFLKYGFFSTQRLIFLKHTA